MSEVYDSNLFLIRFAQTHESFRLPELKALGEIHGIDYRVVDYKHDVSCCSHISIYTVNIKPTSHTTLLPCFSPIQYLTDSSPHSASFISRLTQQYPHPHSQLHSSLALF